MRRGTPPTGSVALASFAAGPIFLVSTALAALYLELPRPVPLALRYEEIALVFMAFIPAIFIGFLLSFVPNFLGSRLLLFTGGALPAARGRVVWTGTGALLGAAIACLTGAITEPAFGFGLIATSACCAAICRLSAYWD
jgi:hypothetical protein